MPLFGLTWSGLRAIQRVKNFDKDFKNNSYDFSQT